MALELGYLKGGYLNFWFWLFWICIARSLQSAVSPPDQDIDLPPLSPHQTPVPVYVIEVKHTHTTHTCNSQCQSLSIGGSVWTISGTIVYFKALPNTQSLKV